MSKQSDAKLQQGYVPKAVPNVCGNCAHRKFDLELPAWMQRRNADCPGSYGENCANEKNQRCSIGGFAIKKMGTRKEWGAA